MAQGVINAIMCLQGCGNIVRQHSSIQIHSWHHTIMLLHQVPFVSYITTLLKQSSRGANLLTKKPYNLRITQITESSRFQSSVTAI